MLIGNYSVLNKNPGRAFGGSTVSDTRAQFGKSGPARGRFYGVEDYGNHEKYGTPNGYLPPYCWVIPIKSGGMASNTLISGSGVLAALGAMGVNGSADLSGIGVLSGDGQTVVSAVAALTGSGTITNAGIVAILQASADLAGSGAIAAALEALGHATADIIAGGTVDATSYGVGTLEADLVLSETVELTPAQIAAAVWNATAAEFADTGSTGKKLIDAKANAELAAIL